MKKLEISQMENLQGAIKNRSCLLIGFLAGASLGLGGIATIGWGTAVGISGGSLAAGIVADCF